MSLSPPLAVTLKEWHETKWWGETSTHFNRQETRITISTIVSGVFRCKYGFRAERLPAFVHSCRLPINSYNIYNSSSRRRRIRTQRIIILISRVV
jgi:hypothetical protein